MATYRWRWWFPVGRDALWPLVSDTDWVNRHAGLPPVSYAYEPVAGGGSRTRASFHLGPLRIEWEEPPFEWSAPEYYGIERRYRSGPLARFRSRTALREENGGTAIDVELELTPRGAFGPIVIPLVAWYGKRGAARAFRAAAELAKHGERRAAPRAGVPAIFGRTKLREAGFSEELLDKLALFVAGAEDRDLAKMRPYELADRWGEPRRTVLRLFLSAVRAGTFNLEWDVICGNCRGTKAQYASLAQLTENAHCDACNLDFGPQFDRHVEVAFNAHPLGRGLNVPMYCMAGPHASRHVVSQENVEPASQRSLETRLVRGRYTANAMFVAQLPFAVHAGSGETHVPLTVDTGALHGIPPVVEGEAVVLDVRNRLERPVLLRIEESEWPDTIVTAADVTAMQDFRDLFSSEVLAAGLEVGIQSMTVLFTDLVGSTALYSSTGDAPAFRVVTEHFDHMRAIVEKYNGAIVKTIGDAIMAVFRDSGDCLEAALRLPAAVGMVKTPVGPLRLRVGFHSGPCISMTANDRLDYFGTTVNLASRLEHTAGGGEVAFSESTSRFPHLEAVVRRYGLHPIREDVDIKGFAEPIAVMRVPAFTSGETTDGAAERAVP
ncbi:MAG: adenylate/guanylate cyclase domain-containing protein [Candidatus Eremiobacteraeota bacterium]|nr:adenylate/guanylate cyclase domain-containing protein [Candidatus Eremiobacteraeota bacterium]